MATPPPDLWFNFIRAHRSLIREIERRLAEQNLPPYAGTTPSGASKAARTAAGACTNWPTCWRWSATT